MVLYNEVVHRHTRFGGVVMDFAITLFQTVIKAIMLGAVAFGGILVGKNLRKHKNEKEAKTEN